MTDILSRLPTEPWYEEERTDVAEIAMDILHRGSVITREKQVKDENLKTSIYALESTTADEELVRWSSRGYLLDNGVLYRYAGRGLGKKRSWKFRHTRGRRFCTRITMILQQGISECNKPFIELQHNISSRR